MDKGIFRTKAFFGAFRTISGNDYLQVVGIENACHAACPSVGQITWEFCKRFARVNGEKHITERMI